MHVQVIHMGLASGVTLETLSTLFFETGFPTVLPLADLARLTGQRATGSHLSLPPQIMNTRRSSGLLCTRAVEIRLWS